jgi:hypothetical protein
MLDVEGGTLALFRRKPDSDSTSRPCIVIENDGDDRVLAEGQNLRGIGVTR